MEESHRPGTKKLGDGVCLVGHSVGGAILMDYLAGGTVEERPAAVFLIATPFIGDGGWPSDGLRPTKMAVELHDGAPLYFYQDGDDETVPVSHEKSDRTSNAWNEMGGGDSMAGQGGPSGARRRRKRLA
jgi:alpha-beta hydrolase superfamily lysophospholipase